MAAIFQFISKLWWLMKRTHKANLQRKIVWSKICSHFKFKLAVSKDTKNKSVEKLQKNKCDNPCKGKLMLLFIV